MESSAMLFDTASILGLFVSLYVLYKILDRLVRIPRIGRYSDRYILVTGCGQGFGLEAVRRLERLGCHVFAGCRRQESVEMLEDTFSGRVLPILMDVSKGESVRAAFECVSSQLPPNTGLWGLVNNAAIGSALPMDLYTIEMYEGMIATNLLGTIDVTMTFLPLVKTARGRVVNVSSVLGRFTLPWLVPYSVSKYGLEAFSDGLRRSLRAYGCKVIVIEPGAVKTQMSGAEKALQNFEAVWRQAQSDGRIGSSEDADDEYWREREKFHRQLSGGRAYGKIDDVIDAYEHALFGVFPGARYVVGMDTEMLIFLQMLPEWLSDWVVDRLLPSSKPYRAQHMKVT